MKRSVYIMSLSLCLLLAASVFYFSGTLGQAFAEGEKQTDEAMEAVWEALWDEAGVYGPSEGLQTLNGDVAIAAADVELQNIIVVGDMILDAPIGEGRTVLRNVTVTGRLVMVGGSSLSLQDSQVNMLIINRPDLAVTVTAEGWTNVWNTRVQSECQLEEMVPEDVQGFGHVYYATEKAMRITANLLSLTLEQRGGPINLLHGQINRIYVEKKAAEAILSLGKTVEVVLLDLMAPIKVRGEGIVELVMVYVDGAEMEKPPKDYLFVNGTSILVAGSMVDEQSLLEPEPEPEPDVQAPQQPKPSQPKPQEPSQPKPSVVIHKIDNITLDAGKTGTRSVTTNPSGATIKAESSNNKVAEVSVSGNTITINAKTGGEVTITVRASTGDANASATFKVTVKAPASSTPSFTFDHYPGLVDPGKRLVVVKLQVSNPGAYTVRMKDGSNYVTLTYMPTEQVFRGEVSEENAVRSNVRISE